MADGSHGSRHLVSAMTAHGTHVIPASLRGWRGPLDIAKITACCALAVLMVTGYVALLAGLLYAVVTAVFRG